jgi:excinuclease ABC subunit A
MHFLPDVYVTCEECKGRRYNSETLEIKFKGKDISEVLEMPIEEALQFFANFPKLQRVLETLDDVGLGYMHTGQASTTLSGGEAQRVEARGRAGEGVDRRTMYILDEPTTGLHFRRHQSCSACSTGSSSLATVVVIEHNMHVIKTADWVIDPRPGVAATRAARSWSPVRRIGWCRSRGPIRAVPESAYLAKPAKAPAAAAKVATAP